MNRFAFLEIATLSDLTDLIGLLREDVTVGVRVSPGLLYGSSRAQAAFATVRPSDTPGFRQIGTKVTWTCAATTLDGFLTAYLDISRPCEIVRVPDCPDTGVMRDAWAILNPDAARPLTGLTLIRLVMLIARWVGKGRVQPQFDYGAPGWDGFVRERMGHLVLWCRPSPVELQEIATFGARGVILGETAHARYEWFAGLAGPYAMPRYGVIDHDPTHGPCEALEAAYSPSRLPGIWDRSKRFLPLTGLLCGFGEDIEAVKAVGWECRKLARCDRANRTVEPALVVTRAFPTIPRDGAGEWVSANWAEPLLYRVDFD